MQKPKVVLITSPSLIGANIIEMFRSNPSIELVGINIDQSKNYNFFRTLKTIYSQTKKSGLSYTMYKLVIPFLAWHYLKGRGCLRLFSGKIRFDPDINSPANKTWLKSLGCDYLCICYCLKRVDEDFKHFAHHRTVVMHASLLPRYAGPEPAMFMVFNGDYKVSGASIIVPSAKLDGGNLLFQQQILFTHFNDLFAFNNELWTRGAEIFADWVLEDFKNPAKFPEQPNNPDYRSFPTKEEVRSFQKERGPLFKLRSIYNALRVFNNL